ncbi:ABC-type lipoprotein export system ATPase subunit/ABC-type antimicrobial peptide transport system permease subunit [Rhodoferax ferrireducens]|uniref:ABC-type lipoprotein export system ATPase subunit/ABC-type antimicrobial peptide transport system permease subunit n=1 Tax=Rhodoferax ferrireducens TaxID=192843 RepID=A0ABU2C7X2_9BURK|nr:ABC transporter permease [Rhodoferax ferrireducens]MDR7377435.1 ABC-type lipoprotein export system ATPase subunit/ABC-type antimicrobial peptide transport system permease subunit [Rhodoferax ferrireducens]
MNLVQSVDLGKSYAMGFEVVHALRGVSLQIAEGDFVAIMGTSGSGKSTLMNILGCLDTPSSGSYALAGEAVQGMDADALALVRNRRIGFVFQQFNLLPRASALENVELPLVYAGVPAAQRRERALAALQRVGLGERLLHTPAELSGGQQQRVAIARALVNGPQLILADEPTGALDSQTSEEVMQLLADLNAQGITVVLVTHEADIAAWARRKIVFKDGQIVEDLRRASDTLHTLPAQRRPEARGAARMNGLAALRSAWRALASNALRSLLTMLGIIIGVAAVITMVAVGRGATDRVQEQMKGLGSNIMLVLPGGATAAGVRQGAQTRSRLTEEDATAIQVEVPEVQVAAPSSRTTAQVVANNANWSTTIFGTTNEYLEAREWPLAAGRAFEDAELQGSAKVALIGITVAQELFGDADPIDQVVRVRTVPVKIVGVLSRKGQNSMGQDQDDILVLPISTYRNRLQGGSPGNVKRVWAINVKVREGQSMQVAEENIRELLRQRFKVEASADDTFTLRNLSEILEAQEASSRTMTLLLAAVAGISLLIGGIGIMNIMLVSVTERTREIGLRMAVGARGRDILVQFLVEAVSLSLLGGAVGVLLGALATWAVGQWAGWQVSMTFASILLAVGFSAAVGVFFGFYPARRASLLQPIQALRHA